jgi:hypothetical protein
MGYECFQKEVSFQTLHTQKTKDITSFKGGFNLIVMSGNSPKRDTKAVMVTC